MSAGPDDDHIQRLFERERMAFAFFLENTFGIKDLVTEKDTILAVYNAYNAEVERAFSGHPRFLKLDITTGGTWPVLCGFLGVPQSEAVSA